MSDPKTPDKEPEKKQGGKMKLVVGSALLLGAGAGAAYGANAMGYLGGHEKAEEAPDLPKLVRKGEEDPYAQAKEGEATDVPEIDGDGGSEYRTSYYAFSDTFTSNLKDSPALVQISLSASTNYDGRVLIWLKKHDLALRSAILTELADTRESEVYTVEGKDRLQKRLAEALNRVLTQREGFGGVDAVYFNGFLVQ